MSRGRQAFRSPPSIACFNSRAGVSERTRAIVFESARRLGYLPEGANGAAAAVVRLDFVLPAGGNQFMATLKDEIESQARARPGLEISVCAIEGFNPDTLAAALLNFRGETDGLGVVALDHPPCARRSARFAPAACKSRHWSPTFSMCRASLMSASTTAPRAARRLPDATLRRRGAAGQVALFAGSLSYRGHEEREIGFRHILAEEAANLRIVELREMHDDSERAYAEAASLLDAYPDLAAIYNLGAVIPASPGR